MVWSDPQGGIRNPVETGRSSACYRAPLVERRTNLPLALFGYLSLNRGAPISAERNITMTTEASATTQAAAVAPQGTHVGPKDAKGTTKARTVKPASGRAKAAKKSAATKTAGKKKVSAAGRAASKKARVLDLLRQKEGATLEQIVQATGWQRHSCRGFLSIAGKSMNITSETTNGDRVYRIAPK